MTKKKNSSKVEKKEEVKKTGIEAFLAKEQVSEGKWPVRYVLEKHPKAEWLVVIFSGFAPQGARTQHLYNFVSALGDFPVHRVYVQDSHGERGVYYLCKDMDFGISEEVSALIKKVQKELSCGNDRTITLGSSKGGSAAIYFALKNQLSHTIVMVPQFRIGTYVRGFRDVLEDMTGVDNREEKIRQLDEVIFDLLKDNRQTKLHVLTSEKDEQYKPQIVPFLNLLKENGLESLHEVTIDNRILKHNDIASFSPEFAQRKLRQLVYGIHIEEERKAVKFWKEKGNVASCDAEYAYYGMDGTMGKLTISDTVQTIPKKEIFCGDICILKDQTEIYRRRFCPWTMNELNAYCTETTTNWVIVFDEPDNCTLPIQYACYIYDAEGTCLHVEKYCDSQIVCVPREGRKGKQVQCYWSYEDFRYSKMVPLTKVAQPVHIDELEYEIVMEGSAVAFRLANLPEKHNAQFAYYLMRNEEVIEKQFYTNATEIRFSVKEPGEYAVRYFVKEGNSVKSKVSSSVVLK